MTYDTVSNDERRSCLWGCMFGKTHAREGEEGERRMWYGEDRLLVGFARGTSDIERTTCRLKRDYVAE